MKVETRKKNVYLNTFITLLSSLLQIVLGFLLRKMFVDFLGVEYLGYNSVFQNVLQLLNLADLGVGIAVTSFLYKPLSASDEKTIASLMYIYKKIYSVLGVVVLVFGIIICLFINELIPDAQCSIGYLRLLFLINLFGTVSTYFLSYSRTLFIADQKTYFVSTVDAVAFICMSVMQMMILIFWPNYILYLVITVTKNVISNVVISLQYKRKYGSIEKLKQKEIIDKYRSEILQYVKDLFISKIGAYAYYSTDNIIISFLKGSLIVGYLSNYTLLTTQVSGIINQLLSSVQSTLGNFITTTENRVAQQKMTDNYVFVNFCIGNFALLGIMFLSQPFVSLFFGSKYLLSNTTVFLLAINLLLTILIQVPSQLFMIYKLYKYDKPIIVLSASLNILISFILVKKIGVDGALIGTTITSLIYLFSRYFVICRKVFLVKYFYYVAKLLIYFCVSVFSVVTMILLTGNMQYDNFVVFVIKCFVVFVVAVSVPIICLFATREFDFFFNFILPKKLKRYISKKNLLVFCVILICISLFCRTL